MAFHKFGMRVDGKLHTLSGPVLNDEWFVRVTENGLPPDWVAWHVEPSEIWPPSERVIGIRLLPKLGVTWQQVMYGPAR